MRKKANYTRSSGNVFADLELPNAEERLLKAQLAVKTRAQKNGLRLCYRRSAVDSLCRSVKLRVIQRSILFGLSYLTTPTSAWY